MTHTTRNRVLLSLTSDIRRVVLDDCEEIELEGRTTLARLGEPTGSVYFPETMVISTLANYRDGSTIEMANIGREACTGINLTLGHTDQLNTNEVQIGGSALELPAKKFLNLKSALPQFGSVLLSTVQAVIYQVMVSGACNGAHTSKERLARWLLTMSDRNDGKTMLLTQEYLSEMLGVRRATVSNAASELQDAGLIEYARGRIRITDHAGLREASCECYNLVRNAYDSLLPERNDHH